MYCNLFAPCFRFESICVVTICSPLVLDGIKQIYMIFIVVFYDYCFVFGRLGDFWGQLENL